MLKEQEKYENHHIETQREIELIYLKHNRDIVIFSFGVLALSVQFSITNGKEYLPIIFLSWASFLISGILGVSLLELSRGLILSESTLQKIRFKMRAYNKFEKKYDVKESVFEIGRKNDEVKNELESDRIRLEGEIKKQTRKHEMQYNCCTVLLFSGISLNLIFIILNVYNKN